LPTGGGVKTGRFPQAFRGDAYRAVYAVKLGNDLWVVHAFRKKSTQGIKTPQREIEVIRERLKRLKEMKP
jgi:phage-related protein